MNKIAKITADLDAATRAVVHDLALARGITDEAFAADAIRRVAESESDFDAFLKKGEDEIARGDFVEHDVLIANLRRWRETRTRPS
jgi:predicted transcriptional regulator